MTTLLPRAVADRLGPVWSARLSRPGYLLLPLRLFLGITFCYAGLQKLAESRPTSIRTVRPRSRAQMQALKSQSPIGPLLSLSAHAPTLVGLLIALGELAVGIGALLGLLTRIAALGGALLALTFFLTVSWATTPYYYGSDIVFLFAWSVLIAFGAGGVLSLDSWLRDRARATVGLPPTAPVLAVPTTRLRELCGRDTKCGLRISSGRCERLKGCPVFAPTERISSREEADLSRRSILATGAGVAGAGVLTAFLAGATAAIGRALHVSNGSPAAAAPPRLVAVHVAIAGVTKARPAPPPGAYWWWDADRAGRCGAAGPGEVVHRSEDASAGVARAPAGRIVRGVLCGVHARGLRRQLRSVQHAVHLPVPRRHVRREDRQGVGRAAAGAAGASAGTCGQRRGDHGMSAEPLTESVAQGSEDGVEGNARLTAANGMVLLVMLAVEGVTILDVRSMLTLHIFLGIMLIPPVLLKSASTLYRFARYYRGTDAYVRKGPPHVLLRVLGPLVILSSLALLGTGVGLLAVRPDENSTLLTLHQASFIVWVAAMTVHVLGHILEAAATTWRELRDRRSARGRRLRFAVLAVVLLAGVGTAAAVMPSAAPWTSAHFHHDDHGGPPR